MRNKLFFLFTLFYSSLFAGWSTPEEIAKDEIDSYIVAATEFDGQGNAIIVHHTGRRNSQIMLTVSMQETPEWTSRPIEKMFRTDFIQIVDDSAGRPHLFWAGQVGERCSFFYSPLLDGFRPERLWSSRKFFDLFDVRLSEGGDFYCDMVASKWVENSMSFSEYVLRHPYDPYGRFYSRYTRHIDTSLAVLKKGSKRWDLFEPFRVSDRKQRQYKKKYEEYYSIRDNLQVSFSREYDSLSIDVNPQGNRLGISQSVPFSSRNILANSLCFDDQGLLRLCWFDRSVGWIWTTSTLNFGTINQEGVIDQVYSLNLDPETDFKSGSYHITPSGSHVAVFNDKKSIVSFMLDPSGEIISSLIASGTSIEKVCTKITKNGDLVVLWKEEDKLYARMGNGEPQLLSNPSNSVFECKLDGYKGSCFMATWQEIQFDEDENETWLLYASIYE